MSWLAEAVSLSGESIGAAGNGVAWSLPNRGELDANLVHLEAHARIGEHVNDAVDVLVVLLRGALSINSGAEAAGLSAPCAILVPKGASRGLVAGSSGADYLSIHRRREGPAIRRPSA